MLALAAIALAFHASSNRSKIQGPSALLALPDQSVWLGVDQELWHLSDEGELLARVASPLGHGKLGVAFLVPHPSGGMAAMVRGDSDIYVLNPTTGQLQERIQLQWPKALMAHAQDSVYLAFHPDGRVAVATGGGHTVALFDRTGKFVNQTPPGTYQFTNGLWWQGDALWTTDTNRFALVNVDASSLKEERRVPLKQTWPHVFLGDAITTPPPMAGGPRDAPLATLMRLSNNMTNGAVVDVWADGRQMAYPTDVQLKPRSMQWRKNGLLVVDGSTFSVLRFDAQRQKRTAFGSAAVQSELAEKLATRKALHNRYVLGLLMGAVCLILGLLAAKQEQRTALQDAGLDATRDLSHLGSPVLSQAHMTQALLKQMLIVVPWIFGAWILSSLVLVMPLAWLAGIQPVQIVLMVLLLFFGIVFGAMLLSLRFVRMQEGLEGVANRSAIRFLQKNDAFWHGMEEGEHPQETLIVREGGSMAMTWVVLTNQRLLIYAATYFDQSLKAQYARSDVVKTRLFEPPQHSLWQRVSSAVWPRYRIDVRVQDGRIWSAWAASSVVAARRLVQSLAQPATRPSVRSNLAASTATAASAVRPQPAYLQPKGSALQQTTASLLVPGLGQWLQRRNRSAAYIFTCWCSALLFVVLPIAWALDGTKTFVPPVIIGLAAALLVLIHLIAAWDAWRMRLTLNTL